MGVHLPDMMPSDVSSSPSLAWFCWNQTLKRTGYDIAFAVPGAGRIFTMIF